MTDRIRRATPVALLLLTASAPAVLAAPVGVTLRVEGGSRTIFEGPVTSDGHTITTPSGGTHPCDGTNNGAHPSAVPTATAALDDGARANAFGWDADWFAGLNDFAVKEVGGESQTSTQFWGLVVNYQFASAGGCQTRVNQGDEVLWAFDAFSKAHVLKLAGPAAASTGAPVTVTVTDGQDGSPQAGAAVQGALTGADGRAALSFDTPGIYRLKAERADSIRSNAIPLCVDPPGADPCTSADKSAPTLQLSLPGRLASERGRSRVILVSWQGDDQAGSGLAHYTVEVSELADGAGASQADGWRTLLDRAPANSVHFRGEAGDAYRFRVTAADRAANRTTVESDPVVIPVDDRSRRLWRFSRGWKRVRASAAWGRTVVRARQAGATARMRFRGGRVALIGRKLARGGRLRVTVQGRSKVLRLRGHSAHRSVLWTSRRLADGAHTLTVRSLGGGTVELDAVAPSP
jgi:hypothetical protein